MKIVNLILKNRYYLAKFCLTTSHISLVFISFAFYNFQRSSYQIVMAYIAAIITEVILFKLTKKYQDQKVLNRVTSAIAESAGLIVLIRSIDPHYYAIASMIAVASKYIFVNRNNKHLFNPTNFAIIMTVAFAPQGIFQIRTDEFNYNLYPILHVLFFGLSATLLAKVSSISFSYILTFILISSVFQGHFNYTNWIDILGPEIGAAGLIFIFLMITDPVTSPRSKKGRIIFGSTLAIMTFYGRTQQVIYSNYISLFICYLAYTFLIESDYIFQKYTKFSKRSS